MKTTKLRHRLVLALISFCFWDSVQAWYLAEGWETEVYPGNPLLCAAGSLSCPGPDRSLSMNYTVTDIGSGRYEYAFVVTAVQELTGVLSEGIDVLVFGDIPRLLISGLRSLDDTSDGVLTAFEFPVGFSSPAPFGPTGSFGGGHNGNYIATRTAFDSTKIGSDRALWNPEVGDSISWTGSSSARVLPGEMFFSYDVRSLMSNSPRPASFVPAFEVVVPLPPSLLFLAAGLVTLSGSIRARNTAFRRERKKDHH